MANPDWDTHRESVNRFIALANELKDEGIDPKIVSGSLMTASGLYASFVVGGNEGGLTDSGVEKVAQVYKQELTRIQDIKKQGKEQPSGDQQH